MKGFALVCLLVSCAGVAAFAQQSSTLDPNAFTFHEGVTKDIGSQPNGAPVDSVVHARAAKDGSIIDLGKDPAVESCRKQAIQNFKSAVRKVHDFITLKRTKSYVLIEMQDFRKSDASTFENAKSEGNFLWDSEFKSRLKVNYGKEDGVDTETYNITGYLSPSGGCKVPSVENMVDGIDGYLDRVSHPSPNTPAEPIRMDGGRS